MWIASAACFYLLPASAIHPKGTVDDGPRNRCQLAVYGTSRDTRERQTRGYTISEADSRPVGQSRCEDLLSKRVTAQVTGCRGTSQSATNLPIGLVLVFQALEISEVVSSAFLLVPTS